MSSFRYYITLYYPFLIVLIVYLFLGHLPNYKFTEVSIGSLYELDRKLFGIVVNNEVFTFNQIARFYHCRILDFFLGLTYLLFVPLPLYFSVYLIKHRNLQLFRHFRDLFTVTMLLGYLLYYLFPAAPPWYYFSFGDTFNSNMLGNASYLNRFDKVVGFQVYDVLYSYNRNVFAAMPSLHCAIPVCCFLVGLNLSGCYLLKTFLLIVVVLTVLAALYGYQHYLLDIIVGVFIPLLVNLFFSWKNHG